jgi:anti-sigma regulatory factor (Ser/Thr protein kinase)
MSTAVGEKYTIFKTFPAKLDKLHDMLQFVINYSNTIGFEHPHMLKIELALEEALVNIINYAYGTKHGLIEIHCSTLEKGGVKIVLKDQGKAFDPLTQEEPQGHDDVGGYGLFLIRKIMDDITYKRENDTNVLTLLKLKSPKKLI